MFSEWLKKYKSLYQSKQVVVMWYKSLYESRYVADNEWYVWLEYLCLKFLFIILSIFWIYLFFNCVHYPCLMNDGWIWSNSTPMKIHKDSMLQERRLANIISLKILWLTSMQLLCFLVHELRKWQSIITGLTMLIAATKLRRHVMFVDCIIWMVYQSIHEWRKCGPVITC